MMAETERGYPHPEMERFRRVIAEQVKFALGIRMPANWRVDVKEFDFGMKIGAAFSMFLLGCEIRRDTETSESVPATWWDHLRLRFSVLRWLFGVPSMRTIATEIKHWHVCPHVAVPDQRQHVEFMVFDDPTGRRTR